NPRQDPHPPGRLDRRGLHRLPDTQPPRIGPVVPSDLLVAAAHPDPTPGPRTALHAGPAPRPRTTDPPVPSHDGPRPLPLSRPQRARLAVQVGELQRPQTVLEIVVSRRVGLDQGAPLERLQGLFGARGEALDPVVPAVESIDQSAIVPGQLQPDHARLAVSGDPISEMRKVLTDLRNHRVVRHPRPTGVLRVVRVPPWEDLRILGVDEVEVISLTQRQLRGPANIPGDDTNPDQVHDVEDVHPGQVLPGPALEQAVDLLV